MPDVTQKTVKLLRDELSNQHHRLEAAERATGALQIRVSRLVDEKLLLEKQLNNLQETVSQDIKLLYDKLT